MKVIGKFKIKDSFTITGRGLVAAGDIIEGKVKIGCIVTFNTRLGNVTLKIGGIRMGYDSSMGGYFVGLLFNYKNESERKKFELLKLKEQVIEVWAKK
jgi:hypothetical protein